MNDFTKDELKRPWGLTKIFNGNAILPLRKKIQSMIENYCVHEWESYQTPYGYSLRCFKCLKEIQ